MLKPEKYKLPRRFGLDFSPSQHIAAICVFLIQALVMFILGVLVGKYQPSSYYSVQEKAAVKVADIQSTKGDSAATQRFGSLPNRKNDQGSKPATKVAELPAPAKNVAVSAPPAVKNEATPAAPNVKVETTAGDSTKETKVKSPDEKVAAPETVAAQEKPDEKTAKKEPDPAKAAEKAVEKEKSVAATDKKSPEKEGAAEQTAKSTIDKAAVASAADKKTGKKEAVALPAGQSEDSVAALLSAPPAKTAGSAGASNESIPSGTGVTSAQAKDDNGAGAAASGVSTPDGASNASGQGKYVIQIASFSGSDKTQVAEETVERLSRNSEMKAEILSAGDGKRVSIVVGSYPDKASAQKQCMELRKRAGFADCFVRQR